MFTHLRVEWDKKRVTNNIELLKQIYLELVNHKS